MTEHNFGNYIELTLRDSLNILIENAGRDLQEVAAEISIDLTDAMLAGRPDLAEQLAEQTKVLLAQKRVEVSNATASAIRAIMLATIRTGVAALTRGTV